VASSVYKYVIYIIFHKVVEYISLMFIMKYTYKRVSRISFATQLLECSKEFISIDYTDQKAVDNL
jgi:hypothetical protein